MSGREVETVGDVRELGSLIEPLIRKVPDFPAEGVLFQDLTGVFADPAGFRAVIDALAATVPDVDAVVGIEARGFLLGSAIAYARGTGVVAVRKPGKLPVVADRESYELEYGRTTLELPEDSLHPGQRVLVVDDVLATGGTMAAACTLVRRAGAAVAGIGVVLEIAALGGRDLVAPVPVRTLITT